MDQAPYRALLDLLGYPPIAGGAPEDDAPEQDQPESAPESGSAQERQSESFTDADISAVPENADREWLAQRYQDMQADYTRKTQEIAETRREAAAMAEIIEAASDPGHPDHQNALDVLGLEVDAPELEEDDMSPYSTEDQLMAKVERLEAERAMEQQAAEQAAIEEYEDDLIAEQISSLQQQEGREFDDAELRILYNEALSNPDERGLPNVGYAYELLKDAYTNRQKDWVSSKRTARRPGSGSARQEVRPDK